MHGNPIATGDLFSGAWFRTNGIIIVIVIASAIVVSRLGTLAIRRFRKRLEGSPNATGPLQARRAATLATTLVTTIRIVVWTLTVLIVLGALGVNLGPLLATAGIAGIALSFGAQSIVKDFLSGFFILLEDQFAVGDVVEVTIGGGPSVSGRVENLTLRATTMRATDGTLATTGNGNILAVWNRSRGEGEIRVELTVPDVRDLSQLRAKLDEAVRALRGDERLQAMLSSGPDPVDVIPTKEGGAVVIVEAQTPASRRKRAEDAIRMRLATSLLARREDPQT